MPIKTDFYFFNVSNPSCKAGRLVGLADCYAVVVLADSATFLLAVNRIAAFRLHSAIIPMIIIRSRGSVGSTSAP